MTVTEKQRMKDLIQTDRLTMKGGSGDQSVMMFGLLLALLIAGGLFVSPLVGCLASLISGIIACTEITNNEMKYQSSRMFCVLPISRRELVRSRFVFAVGITLVINIFIYLLMLLSLKLRLYDILLDDTGEILDMICEKTGGTMSRFSLLNLFSSAALALSLSVTGSFLRNYFKNSEKMAENMDLGYAKNMSAKEKLTSVSVIIVTFAAAAVFVYGFFTGEISFGAAIALVLSLVMQLAQAADGAILCAVFLTVGVFKLVYHYICAVIEYEDRDI